MKTLFPKILILICLILCGCIRKSDERYIKHKITYVQFNDLKPELYSLQNYDRKGNLIENLQYSIYHDGLETVTRSFYDHLNRESERIIVDFSVINSPFDIINKKVYTEKIIKSYDSINNLIKEVNIKVNSNDTLTDIYSYSSDNKLKRVTINSGYWKGHYQDYFYNNDRLIKIYEYDSNGTYLCTVDSFIYTDTGKINYEFHSDSSYSVFYYNKKDLLIKDSIMDEISNYKYDDQDQIIEVNRHIYGPVRPPDIMVSRKEERILRNPRFKYSYQFEYY